VTTLRALLYADLRSIVNAVRTIRRSVGRVVLWIVFGIGVAMFIAFRTMSHHGRASGGFGADTAVSLFLALMIGRLALGIGTIALFRSNAEARFIIVSAVRPAVAIAYLQVRESLTSSARLMISLLYFLAIVGPRAGGVALFVADLVTVGATFAGLSALQVPRRLAGRRANAGWIVGGSLLAFIAALPAIRAGLVLFPSAAGARIVARIPEWHPGNALIHPSLLYVAVALLVGACGVALLVVVARDAYPELFALSVPRIERAERFRRRATLPAQPALNATARARAVRVRIPAPAGSLVFIWKSLLEQRRSASLFSRIAWFGWPIGGGLLALLARGDGAASITAIVTAVANVVLISGFTLSNVGLARELRRPTFWLSDATFTERVAALMFAYSWRFCVSATTLALGFLIAGGLPTIALALGTGGILLGILMVTIGFAGFACFPSAVDQRGPVMLARIIVSYVLASPPAIAFAVVALGLHALIAALGAAALVTFGEAALLLTLTVWRLDGRVDLLAQAV
jgi:hypothetical protein